MPRDEAGKQCDHMGLQRLLVPAAVGKPRIVGDIDEAPVWHEDARLAQDSEAAYAGVEEEDGFGHERSQVSSE